MLYGLLTRLTTHLPPIKRSGRRIRKRMLRLRLDILASLYLKLLLTSLMRRKQLPCMRLRKHLKRLSGSEVPDMTLSFNGALGCSVDWTFFCCAALLKSNLCMSAGHFGPFTAV